MIPRMDPRAERRAIARVLDYRDTLPDTIRTKVDAAIEADLVTFEGLIDDAGVIAVDVKIATSEGAAHLMRLDPATIGLDLVDGQVVYVEPSEPG